MHSQRTLALSATLLASTAMAILGCSPHINQGQVSIFAGQIGVVSSTEGKGSEASFNYPSGVAVDRRGNVYVADFTNQLIRKITPDGTVDTLAGKTNIAGWDDGVGRIASFEYPSSLAVDGSGNVYVVSSSKAKVRKITPDGTVTTLSGPGTPGWTDRSGKDAANSVLTGIAADKDGSLYLSDSFYNLIRKVDPDGSSKIFAGSGRSGGDDGAADQASFASPSNLAIDPSGDLWVLETGADRVREITPRGEVSTLTQNAKNPALKYPVGIAVGRSGEVYVSCRTNSLILKIDPQGMAVTLAGPILSEAESKKNGSPVPSKLGGLAINSWGTLYLADSSNQVIRAIR